MFGAPVGWMGDLLLVRVARGERLPQLAPVAVRADLEGADSPIACQGMLEGARPTGARQLELVVRLVLDDTARELLAQAVAYALAEGLLGPDSWLDEPDPNAPPPVPLGPALLKAVAPASDEPRSVHWAASGERVIVTWATPGALADDLARGMKRGWLPLVLPFPVGQRMMLRAVLPDGQALAVRARHVELDGVKGLRFRLVPALRGKLLKAAGLR